MISYKELPPLSCNKSCRTRIGTGRVRGSNQVCIISDHALEFGGMNVAVMVASRSQSRPTRESALISVKRQRISSFNFDNLMPVKMFGGKWVNDGDAFISDYKFRSLNNAVNEKSNQGAYQNSQNKVFKVFCDDRLKDCSQKQHVSKNRSEKRRLRAKYFNIINVKTPILQAGINV